MNNFISKQTLSKLQTIIFSGSKYKGMADGLPPSSIVNASYVTPKSKYWIDRQFLTCVGTELNFDECEIEATLVYMYGCDRETLFVDCTGKEFI